MYVYDYNEILTTSTENRSEKVMKQAVTKLTEDLKIRGINPGLHFMDTESSTYLKMTITFMNIKY